MKLLYSRIERKFFKNIYMNSWKAVPWFDPTVGQDISRGWVMWVFEVNNKILMLEQTNNLGAPGRERILSKVYLACNLKELFISAKNNFIYFSLWFFLFIHVCLELSSAYLFKSWLGLEFNFFSVRGVESQLSVSCPQW